MTVAIRIKSDVMAVIIKDGGGLVHITTFHWYHVGGVNWTVLVTTRRTGGDRHTVDYKMEWRDLEKYLTARAGVSPWRQSE